MGKREEIKIKLARALGTFRRDPLGYVMFAFPWDDDPSIQLVELPEKYQKIFGCKFGPDQWAIDFLEDLGERIRANDFNGRDAVPPLQFATASGHGIGKSALTAWLVKFILDTRPGSIGTVTANTDTQLRTKTWAQVGFWHNKSITKHMFKYNSGRGNMSLVSTEPGRAEDWKCYAQTCREENSESFAGQHAPTGTSFYIFDEAGGIPDKIFDVREGGTTDGEPMVFDFGNPTRNTGRFFENCMGKFKHRYVVRCIDSRDVSITSKERIGQWIADYGLDSDFVKVRVRGMFPSQGSTQFIPSHNVLEAIDRLLPSQFVLSQYPVVLGVDCARYGDDESVIYPRIGPDARSFEPWRLRGLDTVQLTNKIIEYFNQFVKLGKRPSMIFVDSSNFGIAIADNLRTLGYPVTEVLFGKSSGDRATYKYVCDEIWGKMRHAIGRDLCLPNMGSTKTDLQVQLTQRQYGTPGGIIRLESKEDMKDRLGADCGSPDVADALATTFFMDVNVLLDGLPAAGGVVKHEYDPLQSRY